MHRTYRTNDGFVTEVTVVSQEQYDEGPFDFGASYTNGTLDRVIQSLLDIRESIPAEFRADARCGVGSVAGYEDTHYAQIEVCYQRPATADEIAAFQANESARAPNLGER